MFRGFNSQIKAPRTCPTIGFTADHKVFWQNGLLKLRKFLTLCLFSPHRADIKNWTEWALRRKSSRLISADMSRDLLRLALAHKWNVTVNSLPLRSRLFIHRVMFLCLWLCGLCATALNFACSRFLWTTYWTVVFPRATPGDPWLVQGMMSASCTGLSAGEMAAAAPTNLEFTPKSSTI